MKRYTAFSLLLVLAMICWANAQERTPQMARNPVIWADVPDIAIIRAGDVYYMSSTTMHMAPGLPIMRSTNLVDWDLLDYAYDILADTDSLSLRNGRNSYGRGSWASSFRYHEGVFYVTTFANCTGVNHIYRTTDIESGEWQANTFRPLMHDHSLFFDDDGRVYFLYGNINLRLVELEPDLSGIKPGGFNEIILRDVHLTGGLPRGGLGEGTQIFRKDGFIYVNNITWPNPGGRTQILHRSESIKGPFESRVILQDRGIAQGSLIDTPDGKWYAYLFQDSGSVGRIPYIIPVEWEDGWPILGTEGRVPMTLNIPKEGTAFGNIVESDEFERPEALLEQLRTTTRGENDYVREAFPLAWQWNHNPDNRFWSLHDRPGWLRLTAGRVDRSLLQARNSLTQRTFGPQSVAMISIDVSNMKNGDYAGLAALQRHYGFVGVKMQDGVKSIVMVNTVDDVPNEVASVPLAGNVVHLRIECDFRERRDIATFFWSEDGENWTAIGTPLRMRYTLPHFMGYRFALFNFATQEAGGFVDFDYYRIEGN